MNSFDQKNYAIYVVKPVIDISILDLYIMIYKYYTLHSNFCWIYGDVKFYRESNDEISFECCMTNA